LESDSPHRLTYDVTVDDAVDVALRIASRTRAFRRQFQTNVMLAGVGSAVAMFTVWMYLVGNSLPHVVFGTVAGILFGIVFAAVFRSIFDREIRKQHRKIVAEQFGGQTTIRSELELRHDALWVRQAGVEMLFPWAVCTGVRHNPRDVEISFTPGGLCVIPNRHFATGTDKQAFIEAARRLCANATPTPAT
jgi:hypothetical protein